MATFPSVQAKARSYELTHKTSTKETTEKTNRTYTFRHSVVATGRTFQIQFNNAKSSEVDQINAHYLGQQQHRKFDIPESIWQSHTSLYDVTPANQRYKYTSPPAIEQEAGGLYTVTISLRTFVP